MVSTQPLFRGWSKPNTHCFLLQLKKTAQWIDKSLQFEFSRQKSTFFNFEFFGAKISNVWNYVNHFCFELKIFIFQFEFSRQIFKKLKNSEFEFLRQILTFSNIYFFGLWLKIEIFNTLCFVLHDPHLSVFALSVCVFWKWKNYIYIMFDPP